MSVRRPTDLPVGPDKLYSLVALMSATVSQCTGRVETDREASWFLRLRLRAPILVRTPVRKNVPGESGNHKAPFQLATFGTQALSLGSDRNHATAVPGPITEVRITRIEIPDLDDVATRNTAQRLDLSQSNVIHVHHRVEPRRVRG